MRFKESERSKWSYSSGRVAALESRMAGRDLYERLLESGRLEDLISGLAGSLLAGLDLDPGRLKDSEHEIAAFYRSLMEEIRERSPFSAVANLLLWMRELRAFRNFVKRSRLDLQVSAPESGFADDLYEALLRGTAPDAPGLFRRVAASAAEAFGDGAADAAAFDAVFDSAVLAALLEEASGLGNDFISGYCERLDTVRGIEFLWRARLLDMPGEMIAVLIEDRFDADFMKELSDVDTEGWQGLIDRRMPGLRFDPEEDGGGLRAFVDAADIWLMSYARQARLTAFGPERVFGALAGLEAEASNMRIVIVGRANGISSELLKRRLRCSYV